MGRNINAMASCSESVAQLASESTSAASSPIHACIAAIHQRYQPLTEGAVASYIPELAKVSPDLFGISLITADGQRYDVGAAQETFTIQSISKPFVYGLALSDHGRDAVMAKVGVEPTGEAFNSIIFDESQNRPFNPMVNAGAIATTALIQGKGVDQRFERILELFERFVGHPLTVDEAVFHSERATGHRNRAIAYLELNSHMITEPIEEHLELYFRQCSILVTATDLAVMAATLANSGVNPLTGVKVLDAEVVTLMLSVMTSCGMYDFSGEWLYRVGLPAKSGVGGGIIGVLPGQFGIGTFSPRLDRRGNSVRGIRVCQELSERFNLHLFDSHAIAQSFVKRTYTGAVVSSKKQRRENERDLIKQQGEQIRVYELQGDLYFATMENLLRRLQAESTNMTFLVLEGHRIGRANQSAITLLDEMGCWCQQQQMELILAGFADNICQSFAQLDGAKAHYFNNTDDALEWCEDQLLSQSRSENPTTAPKLTLAQLDVFQSFSPSELAVIQALVEEVHYPAQAFILHQGDDADRLFLLASGSATVSVQLPHQQGRKRLTTFIPGVSFGELALFEPGKRSADIIAKTDVICYVLPFARLEVLITQAPNVYVKLLKVFGKSLVGTVRRMTEEIVSLS